MDVGDDAVIDRYGFDVLIEVLRGRGLRTMGPVVRDGAIVHGEIGTTSDLPEGLARPRRAWKVQAHPRRKLRAVRVGRRPSVVEVRVLRPQPRPCGGRRSPRARWPCPSRRTSRSPWPSSGPGPARWPRSGSSIEYSATARCPMTGTRRAVTERSLWRSSAEPPRAPASALPWAPAPEPVPGTTWPSPSWQDRSTVNVRTTSGSVRSPGPRPWPRFPTGPPTKPCARVAGRSSTGLPSGWAGPSTPRTCPGSWPGISNTRAGARWPNAACRAAIAPWSAPRASAVTSRTSPT